MTYFVSFHVSVSVFVHVAVSRCLVGHNLNFHVETYLYTESLSYTAIKKRFITVYYSRMNDQGRQFNNTLELALKLI